MIMAQTFFKQKCGLVLFSIVFCTIVLEIGLRLTGLIMASAQEYRNMLSMRKNGTYRIICLGESTTAGQYAQFLETILNRQNVGVRFTVIDKGCPVVGTSTLVSMLGENIKEYRPDMIIAMMGINDTGSHMPYQEVAISEKTIHFIRSLRVYKLLLFTWHNFIVKGRQFKPSQSRIITSDDCNGLIIQKSYAQEENNAARETGLKKEMERSPSDPNNYIELADLYGKQRDFVKAEEVLKQSLKRNICDPQIYCALGWVYRMQAKFSLAEESLNKGISLYSRDGGLYAQLGLLYIDQQKSEQAERMFKKALVCDARNSLRYNELGRLYLSLGRFSEAREFLVKALRIDPGSVDLYVSLGCVFKEQANFTQAEKMFLKALEIDPRNVEASERVSNAWLVQGKFNEAVNFFLNLLKQDPTNVTAYLTLGWIYRNMQEFETAEKWLNKAFALAPEKFEIIKELALVYVPQGKLQLAEKFFEKAVAMSSNELWLRVELADVYYKNGKFSQAKTAVCDALRIWPENDRLYGLMAIISSGNVNDADSNKFIQKAEDLRRAHYSPVTQDNYIRLKRIADRNGIRLVCVQYPMRDVMPLKNILVDEEMVIFIDNERIFKDAVEKEGYEVYFIDRFGGDFGHCTAKGNQLLANNIAKVILKEVFKR